jgi:LPXTG-motif cell wall-anchored protein
MRVRRLFGLIGTTAVLSLGFASAAYAVDYPPTTTVQVEGSTVATSTTTTTDGPAVTGSATPSDGLPFTGGNDSALVWIGVAAVGTGTFAAWRFRRRTRVS